jgi:hypothetical protein
MALLIQVLTVLTEDMEEVGTGEGMAVQCMVQGK